MGCNSQVKEPEKPSTRWSEEQIQKWYEQQPWLVGANYAPASAINQLEMWQADTFNPKQINQEFQWAEELGMNTMRVFLHHLLWEQDAQGLIKRMDTFLNIADSHKIKTMFVLLDDVWDPMPKLGKQRDPKPHVHNSGWVQSPGREVLIDSNRNNQLEGYIKGILSAFSKDKRVLIWDLYNEPGNTNPNSYDYLEPENKADYSLEFMEKVFRWAREVNPSQPITVAVWTGQRKKIEEFSAIDTFAYQHSDLISFHAYDDTESTKMYMNRLAQSNRPIMCTEYMARTAGSTFEGLLPVFKEARVAAYNWGFVSGKSQTIYPWESWTKTFTNEPETWFHDILRPDGTPYRKSEVELIQKSLGVKP
ncbi:MAG: cellulase family glycosylhydrolase [Flavobacteriaceae bacterium]